MADSFTTFLQVRLPATGAYDNTWGATLNADALNLLDTGITGWTVVPIGSSVAFSLPALSPGAASVSRYFSLLFTGTPAGECTVTVPSSVPGKMYLINNQTGQTLLFTYSGSTSTTTVMTGEIRLIWCDGENCWPVTANASGASTLNGIPAANWARQSRTAAEITASTVVQNNMTVPTAWPYVGATEAPTTTLDWNNGNSQSFTLTGNRTMAAPVNAVDGAAIDLLVIQDGTGTRTLTWNSIFIFENGLAPILGTAPGSVDRFLMRYNQALNRWTVGHFANLNAGAGTTVPITITGGTLDWNLKAIIGTLGSPATINILVSAGAIMQSSSAGTPAMDLSGLISGCTINLTNLGFILGKGGRGGRGAGGSYPGVGVTLTTALAGQPGGIAIKGPGSGCTFNITNGNGAIWGGGGGGGGGGVSLNQSSNGVGNGGGGGAGSGAAFGGEPGLIVNLAVGAAVATAGGDSTSGVNGTFGAAGVSAVAGSGAGAGDGGAGGDWGAAGTAGVANTTFAHTSPAGAAGAAAKAIELSGGAATFISGSGSPQVKGAVS